MTSLPHNIARRVWEAVLIGAAICGVGAFVWAVIGAFI